MNSQSKFSRRTALGALATATGSLFLRSLATGIPSSVLLDPLSAHAGTEPTAKTLILASSISGDPMNANVPGTYDFPANEVFHPADPSMPRPRSRFRGRPSPQPSRGPTSAKASSTAPPSSITRPTRRCTANSGWCRR